MQCPYSAANPITLELVEQARKAFFGGLCKRSYGCQTDAQSLGYDHLCAVAIIAYMTCKDTYRAVAIATVWQESVPYINGFMRGWDALSAARHLNDPEYLAGVEHGTYAVLQYKFDYGGLIRSADLAPR